MTIENLNVFKIGGSVLDSAESIEKLINCLKPEIKPGKTILAHGGGNEISSWLGKLGIKPEFIDGQRVTDEKTIEVVEMVLSGKVNKEIVSALLNKGLNALGLSGRDGNLAQARVVDEKLGFVGEVDKVNTGILMNLLDSGVIPVLSPICIGQGGMVLNVNADYFACEIAVAVGTRELNIVTNTGGVLKEGKLIEQITCGEIEGMKEDKTVYGGMIPKLMAAQKAIKGGVGKVNLMNYEGKIGTTVV